MKVELKSPASSYTETKTRSGQTQRLLFFGFGGLWLLLAVTGLYALSVLGSIQTRNERIRQDYFNRDRILEQLRSDIYLSGTYVRDLLLEQDHSRAEMHRKNWKIRGFALRPMWLRTRTSFAPKNGFPFNSSQARSKNTSIRYAPPWNGMLPSVKR